MKWTHLINEGLFATTHVRMSRYSQLVNRLVSLDRESLLIFQDEFSGALRIIQRCYSLSQESDTAIMSLLKVHYAMRN